VGYYVPPRDGAPRSTCAGATPPKRRSRPQIRPEISEGVVKAAACEQTDSQDATTAPVIEVKTGGRALILKKKSAMQSRYTLLRNAAVKHNCRSPLPRGRQEDDYSHRIGATTPGPNVARLRLTGPAANGRA